MKTGDKYSLQHIAGAQETADNIGSGGLAVFATPAMAALMEKAAYTLARQHGFETVGTKLEISHDRACLPGTVLTAAATLTGIDGRKLSFTVEVSDGKGLIGKGLHERFTIDPERFMSKLGQE